MSATLPSRAVTVVRRPRRTLRFARDEELVRLLRSGHDGAFEAIYDRHHRGILSFTRHMLGSREEAEDAVQHTFAAAHKHLVETDKAIQLKPWLYTIARNRCLSVLRVRRDERALEDAPEPSVDGLGAEVHRRQELRDLLADLQRLPEDQRAALVLAELGDLSHEEIAEAIGVRTGKVKALVFQARESLAGSRAAREADCHEIQEQLAVLRGGALRRTTIRRHVDECVACAAFKAEVQRQRSQLAAVLPVVPTLALKGSVLSGAGAGGAGAAGAGGAGAGAGAAGGAGAGGAGAGGAAATAGGAGAGAAGVASAGGASA
ncbi:MAG TPA: RNA polymerase sigma factor, partial [Solirubrobacteraceae bacterium]|nr:RNA polymerase sigma factor [Solirubrobacteraceae bacterium]